MKKIYKYNGPLLCISLLCSGLLSGTVAASGNAKEPATESYLNHTAEDSLSHSENIPGNTEKRLEEYDLLEGYDLLAEYETEYEKEADSDALSIKEGLLRLRIRLGEDFLFPMEIPETAFPEEDALLRDLRDYRELRSCPLPRFPKTIGLLKKQLTGLTEQYSGEWSVYIKNLTTGDSFTIHDTPMRSASVMKLFIMGTVYEAMDLRELERTSEIVELLTAMICDSSNSASNELLSILGNSSYADGIARVNDYIARHGYSARTHEYNGFEDSAAICDSEHFNQVTAADCGKLLERIYRRTFASRRVCNEIETLMLNQNTRYKIPKGLPEGVEVGNKTGEMDTVENDAAIIYGPYSDYILCVLSGEWDSKEDAISNIQEISATVYDFFNDTSYYQEIEPDSYQQLAGLIAAAAVEEEKSDIAAEDPEASEETSEGSDTEDGSSGAFDPQKDGFFLPDSESGETAPLSLAEAFPFLTEAASEDSSEDTAEAGK